MDRGKTGFKTIDEYIASFPADVQRTLRGLRATIRAAAPGAEEKISYGIPTFALNGNLVHFAAFEKHISFFPTSSGVRAFRLELAAFSLSKGTIRFPMGRPLPLRLIARIVKFRVAESLERAKERQTKRTKKPS